MTLAHAGQTATGKLRLALYLTVFILAVELVAGFLAHSLAVLSDAGHVFTDLAALGLAWYAAIQAERPADASKTFGYHRTEILAALVNAATLLIIVGVISFEAVLRFQHTQHVQPGLMSAAALVGIAVNLYIAYSLGHQHDSSLNLRAALLHVFGDVAAGAGVLVAAVLIALTGWYVADPLISLLIAALIARGAWDILRETVDILMESTPRGLEIDEMVREMTRAPGVVHVHDLHVWTISGGKRVLSAHVHLDDQRLSDCEAHVRALNEMLRRNYGIDHSTLQIEATCCNTDLYCNLSGAEAV
jgi:cobalt-zinc-cadmium efflux system protein